MSGPGRREVSPGPRRRSNAIPAIDGLNYAAIGAVLGPESVAFPPDGFVATEQRHRLGSGTPRFEAAARALMTWSAFRNAGYAVDDVVAERTGPRGHQPVFLEDGTPWITAGMTATVTYDEGITGPVKVVAVVDEPGCIGYAYGSRIGHPVMVERLLLVERDDEDGVWMLNRSLWQVPGSRLNAAVRAWVKRQKELDRRLLTALHPSNSR